MAWRVKSEGQTFFLYNILYLLLYVKTLLGMAKLQMTTSRRWLPCDVWQYLYATMACVYGVVEQTGVDVSLIVSDLQLHGAGWSCSVLCKLSSQDVCTICHETLIIELRYVQESEN